LGSANFILDPLISKIFDKNSISVTLTTEVILSGCKASLELAIRPELKGRCENHHLKPVHSSRPPIHASPPKLKLERKSELETEESEFEEGTRYVKSSAKQRSSSLISMKKPSCRDSSASR